MKLASTNLSVKAGLFIYFFSLNQLMEFYQKKTQKPAAVLEEWLKKNILNQWRTEQS